MLLASCCPCCWRAAAHAPAVLLPMLLEKRKEKSPKRDDILFIVL